MGLEKFPTWIPVVALALQREDGRWLMHRRPAGKAHGGMWEFPGGKVEPTEHPQNALVREIDEEIGIMIQASDLMPAAFAQTPLGTGEKPIVIFLYACANWVGDAKSLEGGSIDWFLPEEIAGLKMPPLDVELASRLFAKTRS